MQGSWSLLATLGVLFAGIGFLAGLWLSRRALRRRATQTLSESKATLEEARRQAELLRRDAEVVARERALKVREQAESQERAQRAEVEERSIALARAETRLIEEHERLRREETLLEEERGAAREESRRLADREAHLTVVLAEQRARLERIAGLSAEDARRELIRGLEEEARAEAARLAHRLREEVHRDVDAQSRRLILIAMQRMAADQSIESTVTVVPLPSDEMKGRIIGREGRNIRAFEMATGIDVVIDDTPEAVILSGFDPARREIARRALERLVADGRIHPGRIEEIVAEVAEGFDGEIVKLGEEAAGQAGVHGIAPEILHALGRLHFRTSSGQNVLRHSVEVARLAELMAAEIGLDREIARRAALLHDVGKALGAEIEGPHALAGMDFLRRHGEPEVIHEAVGAHHGEIASTSLYPILVAAADAISSARPGSRREALENYVRRLHKLEEIAASYPGVEKAYAIQAGREIRILVQHDRVGDLEADGLAHSIARRIERDLPISGQVKVVVIREMRAVDFAR